MALWFQIPFLPKASCHCCLLFMLTILLLPFVCLMNFLNKFCEVCIFCHTLLLKSCLARWSANGWTKIFLKCLESGSISLRLHQRVLCICWGMLSIIQQAAYSSALVFNSCFYRASRSVRRGRFRPSQVFPKHGHSVLMCMTFSYPGNMAEPTVNISLPSFCFEVLGQLFVCPSCFSNSGNWDVKKLPLIVFNTCPGEKTVCSRQTLNQVKGKLCELEFPWNCQTCWLIIIL